MTKRERRMYWRDPKRQLYLNNLIDDTLVFLGLAGFLAVIWFALVLFT